MRLWMAPAGLHIEPATVGDAGGMAKLHAASFFRGWPAGDFAAYIQDPAVTPAFIACDRKRNLAGFAVLRMAEDEAELLSIAVAPKWRRRGVGRALMDAALADLLHSPARHLFLEVDRTNQSAIALYRRLGFADVGTRKNYYPRADGSAGTALVMRLALL